MRLSRVLAVVVLLLGVAACGTRAVTETQLDEERKERASDQSQSGDMQKEMQEDVDRDANR